MRGQSTDLMPPIKIAEDFCGFAVIKELERPAKLFYIGKCRLLYPHLYKWQNLLT